MPLRVGSPAAVALHDLWSGRHFVTVGTDPVAGLDQLTTACLLIQRLVEARPSARVMFAADRLSGVQQRINGFRSDDGPSRLLAMPWQSYLTALKTRGTGVPLVGINDGLDRSAKVPDVDLLVVDPDYTASVERNPGRWCNRTRQVLILVQPGQPPLTRGNLTKITLGHQRPVWGQMPIEVVLAGARD